MAKAILYGNGTGENHGCEAITVSTINILDDLFQKYYCTTTNRKYDLKKSSAIKKYEYCELIEYYYYRKKSLPNLMISKAERALFHTNKFFVSKPWLTNYIKALKDCDVALSVGGDNYCNPGVEWLYESHREAIKANVKTILWGASVEGICLKDDEMREDLAKFDLICARESLSYEFLKKVNGNVRLYPDPAFVLEPEKVELPFSEDIKTVGINLSPTIMQGEKIPGLVKKNYEVLIRYLLEETDYNIVLIPHVTFSYRYCDYEVLYPFYKENRVTNRIYMIEDMNCRKLKYLISNCDFFITARTHASIAAYSTCVPTVVVGYSIKADGIATDIFGSSDHYVLNRDKLRNDDDLINAFLWMEENGSYIREHLKKVMVDYIPRAYKAFDSVKEIMG